jgi:hypothetical protein
LTLIWTDSAPRVIVHRYTAERSWFLGTLHENVVVAEVGESHRTELSPVTRLHEYVGPAPIPPVAVTVIASVVSVTNVGPIPSGEEPAPTNALSAVALSPPPPPGSVMSTHDTPSHLLRIVRSTHEAPSHRLIAAMSWYAAPSHRFRVISPGPDFANPSCGGLCGLYPYASSRIR